MLLEQEQAAAAAAAAAQQQAEAEAAAQQLPAATAAVTAAAAMMAAMMAASDNQGGGNGAWRQLGRRQAPSFIPAAAAALPATTAPHIPTPVHVSAVPMNGVPRGLMLSIAPVWLRGRIVAWHRAAAPKRVSDGSRYPSGIRQRGTSGDVLWRYGHDGNRRRLRRNQRACASTSSAHSETPTASWSNFTNALQS